MRLLSEVEKTLLKWDLIDLGGTGCDTLQDLGVPDPVSWLGSMQAVGSFVRQGLFTETSGVLTLSSHIRSTLTELMHSTKCYDLQRLIRMACAHAAATTFLRFCILRNP